MVKGKEASHSLTRWLCILCFYLLLYVDVSVDESGWRRMVVKLRRIPYPTAFILVGVVESILCQILES